MGGLAPSQRARGLPEGDPKRLQGEGSLFAGPRTLAEEPIPGDAFTAGWTSGGSHSLLEEIIGRVWCGCSRDRSVEVWGPHGVGRRWSVGLSGCKQEMKRLRRWCVSVSGSWAMP